MLCSLCHCRLPTYLFVWCYLCCLMSRHHDKMGFEPRARIIWNLLNLKKLNRPKEKLQRAVFFFDKHHWLITDQPTRPNWIFVNRMGKIPPIRPNISSFLGWMAFAANSRFSRLESGQYGIGSVCLPNRTFPDPDKPISSRKWSSEWT